MAINKKQEKVGGDMAHSAGPARQSLAQAAAAYETVALVLQGGGALGAYQAGVYQGLDEAGIIPNWISGISIGALTTAVIAGNAPENRVTRLREFWETVCQPAPSPFLPLLPFLLPASLLPEAIENAWFASSETTRKTLTSLQAASAIFKGQQGFYVPRCPPPLPMFQLEPTTVSWYDMAPLKSTLERLCDFDRINSHETHVSVGAVNVRNGNFVYFDNTKHTLRPEHFVASGALPPGFGAVEIDGEFYWDGGLVSNTPLDKVLQTSPRRDTLTFQVDLWSALGSVPDALVDVASRMKDIQFSSRTRFVTDHVHQTQEFRQLLRELLKHIPPEVRETDYWCHLAESKACSKRYNVIHLIYQHKEYEGHDKDYQFGQSTMREHWESGLSDIRHTLEHEGWLDMPTNDSGFITHDLHRYSK